jgi:hypothetical protein
METCAAYPTPEHAAAAEAIVDQYVRLDFERIDDKTVCAVSIQPASAPAYLTFKSEEDFTIYIRAGNSSQPLALSKVAGYVQTRFSSL